MYNLSLLISCTIALYLCFLIGVTDSKSLGTSQFQHLQQRQFNAGTAGQQSYYYPITGIPTSKNAQMPQRLEIRQLRKNAAQWDLYLLALRAFQAMNQQERTSYYQIAGIHGRPFIPWDNVGFAAVQSNQYEGYCPHSSLLFPTWHRPYVVLFEQVLYGIVQDLAVSYKSDNASSYVAAAKTFRAPYWDWAAVPPKGEHVMPESLWWPGTLQVFGPNGAETFSNPLYRYDFNPLNSDDFPKEFIRNWHHTLRAPKTNATDAESQDNLINEQLDAAQPSYSKRLLTLFQSYPNYDKFSTKAWMPKDDHGSADSYDSIESIHNAIHALVGGYGGHFEYNDYSAFDPLFWLHHVQIDRIFAIWQTLYPDTFLTSTYANFTGTATITPGSALNEDSPLTPFHKDTEGKFWTSAQVRDPSVFGYTYPETAGGNACATIEAINSLYAQPAGTPSFNVTNVDNSATSFAHNLDAKAAQEKKTYYEWIINIRIAQNAVPSTFNVMIFLGYFNEANPKAWAREPSYVGPYSVSLPIDGMSGPSADMMISGTVPLSNAINKNAKEGGYNPEDPTAVAAYLKKNLHWAALEVSDNSEVSLNQIPSLRVSVVKCLVTAAESECAFPDWGHCTPDTGITGGKPGGLKNGERA